MKKIIIRHVALLFLSMQASLAVAALSTDEQQMRIALEASPSSPYPGGTVRVQARVTPSFDEAGYGIRWKWQGGTSNFRADSESAVVYEGREEPAALTATLWSRVGGHDVASAELTVVPLSYALAIHCLTPEETIQLWDDGKKASSKNREERPKPELPSKPLLTLKPRESFGIPGLRTRERSSFRRKITGA